MKRALTAAIAVFAAAVVAYWLSAPRSLSAADVPAHDADVANGERLFWAGGCASCHSDPDAPSSERPRLGGGLIQRTPFGTFRAPNISPDPEHGIGAWSTLDFLNAMVHGVAPDGRHYYPAFPYPYYTTMRLEDLIDLKAFLDGLPPSDRAVAGHDIPFPYSIRRGLGLWKRLYGTAPGYEPPPDAPDEVSRGAYLVRGPGHCGACHTPRNAIGGERPARFLAGAAALELVAESDEREGSVPNITPHEDGIADWSLNDIAFSLETGFDPSFDSFGGSMVDVQENLARLPAEDRRAIAAYLKAVPAVADNDDGG